MAAWMQSSDNLWLYITLVIVAVIFELIMICVRKVARSVPVNYIILLLFTLCESYVVAWIC